KRFDDLVVAGALHEHGRCRIRTTGGIDVGAAVDAVVVEHHDANRQAITADRLDFHAGEPEGAVALHRKHGFAGFDRRRDGETHADAHDTPGANIEALARL